VLERGPAHTEDHLFSPGGFLIDANADSQPDDIRARIVLEDEPDAEMWCALLDLAARLGLETAGFSPPLIVNEPAVDQFPIVVRRGRSIRPHFEPSGWHGRKAIVLEGPDAIRDLTIHGQATWQEGVVPDPPARAVNLAHLFEVGGLLVDSDANEIPDGTSLCVVIPEDLPRAVGIGLFHFITRLAMESSGINLPIAVTNQFAVPRGAVPLRLRLQDGYLARLSTVDHPTQPSLELFGDRADVAAMLERLAVRWPSPPCLDCGQRVDDILEWIRHSLAGWTAAGRSAALVAGLKSASASETTLRLLSTDDQERDAQARLARTLVGDDMRIVGPGPARFAFTQEWSARWEVDRLLDVLHEDILPRLDRRLALSVIA
jgi:hypothetical protein